MTTQTTQDIIKILPFKPEFKDELLDNYESLTEDQRFGVERIVWDLYDSLYEVRLEKNMELAFERAKKNEEQLDHAFYERVRKQTDQELAKEYSAAETTVELADARDELKKLLGRKDN